MRFTDTRCKRASWRDHSEAHEPRGCSVDRRIVADAESRRRVFDDRRAFRPAEPRDEIARHFGDKRNVGGSRIPRQLESEEITTCPGAGGRHQNCATAGA